MRHTIMVFGNVYKEEGGHKAMSYVDEVYELVVAKNPAQPEFHQAVKEVLEDRKSVV